MTENQENSVIKVTIGLVDGEVAIGFIKYFTPFTLHLQIWPDTCKNPNLPEDEAVFLHTKHIAYLAQHRDKTEEIAFLEGEDIENMKVQLAGGHKIQVKVSLSSIHNPTGFSGIPVDQSSPYRLFYFYGHAVYTKENPDPIGKMLIKDGLVDEKGIEAGVEYQRQARQTEKPTTLISTAQHTQISTAQHTQISTAQHTQISTAQHTQISDAQHTQISDEQHKQRSTAQHKQRSTAQHKQRLTAQHKQSSTAQHTQEAKQKPIDQHSVQATHDSEAQSKNQQVPPPAVSTEQGTAVMDKNGFTAQTKSGLTQSAKRATRVQNNLPGPQVQQTCIPMTGKLSLEQPSIHSHPSLSQTIRPTKNTQPRAKAAKTSISAKTEVKAQESKPDLRQKAPVDSKTIPSKTSFISNQKKEKTDTISHPVGQVLVQEGLISQKDLTEAIAKQQKARSKRLGQVLVDLGMINEQTLYRTLAKKFHLPFVDLDKTPINENALKEIHLDILNKHLVLPIDSDNKNLLVAISDPLDMDVYDVLRFQVKKHITQTLACPSQINAKLMKLKPVPPAIDNSIKIDDLIRDLYEEPEDPEDESEVVQASSDSAIVKLANQVIVDAYNRGASDIHIEPRGKRKDTIIRFRVDGRCTNYQAIPAKSWRSLVARYKIISGLDIAERRKPQDGKIVLRRPDGKLELRVATIPMVEDNEAIVLRILASSKPLPLAKMGLSTRNLDELLKIMKRPYGLFLCVGPTGSGKTTTLHSSLGEINKPERKIWTAEDPVEITQAGLCQVQVRPNIGYNFAAAMRAFLRADPDVIMIGEMRDQETASIAVEASLTGHLVISTLHTNSAPETITRLLDMGLDPFSFSDALAGVLAQRLARRLCTACRQEKIATQKEYDTLAKLCGRERFSEQLGKGHRDLKVYTSSGCEKCQGTGYTGRLAIHELLVSNDEIKVAIERRAPVSELRALAMQGGMTTLQMDGIEKCLQGITDLKQIQAVCTA